MLLYPLRHRGVAHCNKDYGASTAHKVKRCSSSSARLRTASPVALSVLGGSRRPSGSTPPVVSVAPRCQRIRQYSCSRRSRKVRELLLQIAVEPTDGTVDFEPLPARFRPLFLRMSGAGTRNAHLRQPLGYLGF